MIKLWRTVGDTMEENIVMVWWTDDDVMVNIDVTSWRKNGQMIKLWRTVGDTMEEKIVMMS
jgi:hypothetical protein